MCSFIVTNKKIKDEELDDINFYTQLRGPDLTSLEEAEGFVFVHNLLSITGDLTPQPFKKGNIVCLYNGEIYNYDKEKYSSDGECLIDLYIEHGGSFTSHLEGEFAIALFDFDKDILVLSTDSFSTKPLWISTEGGLGVSTYRTPLVKLGFSNPIKIKANTIRVSSIYNPEDSVSTPTVVYELNQHKTTFNDWTISFEESIAKRTQGVRENIFIGLSSGYDSGAICCELLKTGTKFKAYSVRGSENSSVLEARHKLVTGGGNEHELLNFIQPLWQVAHQHIEQNVEEFKYTIRSMSSDYNEYGLSLKDDNGSNGLSFISSLAKRDDCKIYLSGQGADELFSDYGFMGEKKYPHSNFGGLFPDDLSTIFPWPSVFESSMESYLAKEEHVAGSYGLEARYPFLDPKVVQEFLWLTPELKNSNYKSVIHNYLQKNNFPMCVNEKIGF
jgi:asparagine synthetase B (glutamine-hydrolysing)